YRIAPIQIRQANRFLTLSEYQYPDLSQYSAVSIIAVNLDTGEILFSKEADKVWPIASITKMMSALVILDKWSLDDEIVASGDDYVQIERHVGLRDGETFSVKEGLEMMIMYSYNDVPVAFARAYDGGYPAFVNAMNQKAKELGMDSSHFEVVEGLSGDNVSTANDLISLTREFLENDLCREISSTKNQSVSLVDSSGNSRNIEFANTNQLIFSVPENVGIKTGFLYVSGENFVSLFNYDNLGTKNEIVIVVLGSSDRFGETNSLFQSIKNY
ncbi:MAG TPA: serine hydrolase, partial [Candidatus Dojkabacteria bacterium]|nr:serine hydrolase [Candidatus Dojkabacteria bacterium]